MDQSITTLYAGGRGPGVAPKSSRDKADKANMTPGLRLPRPTFGDQPLMADSRMQRVAASDSKREEPRLGGEARPAAQGRVHRRAGSDEVTSTMPSLWDLGRQSET